MRGWFRLPATSPSTASPCCARSDAFPPTAFNARLPVAWTPTVELTAHIRASPAPGWLRCRFSTRFVTAGFLEEDGLLWHACHPDLQHLILSPVRPLSPFPRALQLVTPGRDRPAPRLGPGYDVGDSPVQGERASPGTRDP